VVGTSNHSSQKEALGLRACSCDWIGPLHQSESPEIAARQAVVFSAPPPEESPFLTPGLA